jgi:hypothetical protein
VSLVGPIGGLGGFGFGALFLGSPAGIFLTGLGILVANALRTIFVLLFFYALAEFLIILAGLLRNTRAIRGFSEQAPLEAKEQAPSVTTERVGSQSMSD